MQKTLWDEIRVSTLEARNIQRRTLEELTFEKFIHAINWISVGAEGLWPVEQFLPHALAECIFRSNRTKIGTLFEGHAAVIARHAGWDVRAKAASREGPDLVLYGAQNTFYLIEVKSSFNTYNSDGKTGALGKYAGFRKKWQEKHPDASVRCFLGYMAGPADGLRFYGSEVGDEHPWARAARSYTNKAGTVVERFHGELPPAYFLPFLAQEDDFHLTYVRQVTEMLASAEGVLGARFNSKCAEFTQELKPYTTSRNTLDLVRLAKYTQGSKVPLPAWLGTPCGKERPQVLPRDPGTVMDLLFGED